MKPMKGKATAPKPLFDQLEQLQQAKHEPRHLTLIPRYLGDYRHSTDYLLSYRGSESTFNAYRREIERFLQWIWFEQGLTIAQVERMHIEAYIDFCQAPPKHWLGQKQCPRFINNQGERIPNPDWRPFVMSTTSKQHAKTQLSEKSLQALFSILSSYFQFLLQNQCVYQNPVAQIRQKSKYIKRHQHLAPVRRLSELQWSYVLETAYGMAKEDPPQHERSLFMLSLLYGLYLRISELCASSNWTPTMSDFKQDADGHWWFYTLGKGNKVRDISVSDDVLKALKRYRRHLGMTPLPALDDSHYLFPKLTGKGPISSTRHVRCVIQTCFDRTMAKLKSDGFNDEAKQMAAATVHWLRHTGISEDVKHRPREHVRDDAGHSSSAITDRYIDIERRARHQSAKNKKLLEDPISDDASDIN